MIDSFVCRRTRRLFTTGKATELLKAIESVVKRKLSMLHMATTLDDLRVPPGNRLEALKGNRKGQHSIRINQQYRLCFLFTDSRVEDIEIVDYHN
ncbi:MAG: type II toxin-antitoxin system RelE/ParE family toxin [Gammaproteobacteria bacterium]|nr:type II toxin-antitoxin system RelE/ParE family toxin [Gammaproteobacteria bacterium]